MIFFCLLLIVGVITNTHAYIFIIGILILFEIIIITLKDIFKQIDLDKRN
jgi:hypothetical protein